MFLQHWYHSIIAVASTMVSLLASVSWHHCQHQYHGITVSVSIMATLLTSVPQHHDVTGIMVSFQHHSRLQHHGIPVSIVIFAGNGVMASLPALPSASWYHSIMLSTNTIASITVLLLALASMSLHVTSGFIATIMALTSLPMSHHQYHGIDSGITASLSE